jgi:hypothetical protein
VLVRDTHSSLHERLWTANARRSCFETPTTTRWNLVEQIDTLIDAIQEVLLPCYERRSPYHPNNQSHHQHASQTGRTTASSTNRAHNPTAIIGWPMVPFGSKQEPDNIFTRTLVRGIETNQDPLPHWDSAYLSILTPHRDHQIPLRHRDKGLICTTPVHSI